MCVGLSSTDLRTIISKSTTGMSWVCNACRNSSMDPFSELKATIADLVNEIADLKKQIASSTHTHPNTFNFEEVIQEVEERQVRKRNIIVLGVAECTASTKKERDEYERVSSGGIINYLCPDIPSTSITASRLGKYDPHRSKPRLLKVKLSDEDSVHRIIRKARDLRDSISYKSIRIFYDKTPKQIEYFNTVRMELKKRIDDGENDLRIKYVRGIPTIVKLN